MGAFRGEMRRLIHFAKFVMNRRFLNGLNVLNGRNDLNAQSYASLVNEILAEV